MNPFEDADGAFQVLVNSEGQYSLWPLDIPVPGGWQVSYVGQSRQDCLAYVDIAWADMRPESLIRAMAKDADRPSE